MRCVRNLPFTISNIVEHTRAKRTQHHVDMRVFVTHKGKHRKPKQQKGYCINLDCGKIEYFSKIFSVGKTALTIYI